MRPLARLLAATGRKAFSVPGFWVDDAANEDLTWYPTLLRTTSWRADREDIEHDFELMVEGAYKRNGVVFACILARLLAFTEARFQYQQMNKGRPGDLFGTADLSLLETPWPNGTTGELLARMEQDASLAGNFYATVTGTGANRRFRRLRPDWVSIVSGVRGVDDGDPLSIEAEVLGYIYHPRHNGVERGDPVFLSTDRVVHYSPIPDPVAQWRGMSWVTPVIREIQADSATTRHKLKFFENGATPGYVIKYDGTVSPDTFQRYVELFREQHGGVDNAYKPLHIGGGADPIALGTDLKQLDFSATQASGETRIASAAGVGAIIARLSAGMQGSSLNAGNYNSAKRQFADMTIRPLWRIAAASLAKPDFVKVPAGTRLWYDDRDISFLQEDQKDAAEIALLQAQTIRQLTDGGYTAESVKAAVAAGDFSLLKHSGMYSVQLQPAGDGGSPAPSGGEQ